MIKVTLKKGDGSEKHKFRVIIHRKDGTTKRVSFGANGYSDYTKHKDEKRRDNYIARHRSNENWKMNGIETAGFWSSWLLWEKPSLREAIKNMLKKGIKITMSKS